MSSAGFGRRRGTRLIVSRGQRVGEMIPLTLACGHIVERNYRASSCLSAICPKCARTDGAKRDASKVPT